MRTEHPKIALRLVFQQSGFTAGKAHSSAHIDPKLTVQVIRICFPRNGDGDVNAIDLNLMRRALIGLYNKTASMDVNKDDELNAIDLNLFRRMLIGLYAPTK